MPLGRIKFIEFYDSVITDQECKDIGKFQLRYLKIYLVLEQFLEEDCTL